MRTRVGSAHVLAVLALFIALGGTGYAAVVIGPNSVGARELKKNAVTTKKVKDRSLLSSDFKAGQLPEGPAGPQGAAGPQGPAGPQGAIGPSQSREVRNTATIALAGGGPPTEILRLSNLEPGAYVLRAVVGLYGSAGGTGVTPLSVLCRLDLGPALISTVQDTFVPNTDTPTFASDLTVPLQGTAEIVTTTDATVSCSRFSGGSGALAYNGAGTSLIATKVGSLGP